MRSILSVVLLLSFGASAQTVEEQFAKRTARLWSLQPVKEPAVPAGVTASTNPIDAFIAADYQTKKLTPAGKADKLTLLRRVSFDLIGLPPTAEEQAAFLADTSDDAYEKVVDRLLANEQHGVRWGRRWLDVLRYADLDGLDGSVMPASNGIYLWRDWVIQQLNRDLPYDQFVRAQILGNRYAPEMVTADSGRRSRAPGSVEDTFALGFLARSAVTRDDRDRDIPFAAVETISTAFMGMTVGCAKCHDHKFDPITQKDFYSFKAIFDPLVLKNVMLATPAEIFANGEKAAEYKKKNEPIAAAIEALVGPYRKKLYEERVALLTPDVQEIIRKTERQRTPAEQKIADDYFPVLRIDPSKFKQIMPAEDVAKYDALTRQQRALGNVPALPSYWTVEEDKGRLAETSYVLTTGDPKRPEKDHPVQPGFPFQPKDVDFYDGRREGFVDWLTAPQNPLFARVAVNRIWGWHFGEGLQRVTSDFGLLGGMPSNQKLLDYLAAEFVAHHYDMKWLHRLIVTSNTYQLSSKVDPAVLAKNQQIDARDTYLWHFRLQRLDAESIWDSIHSSAGDLDLAVGGKSFQLAQTGGKRAGNAEPNANRRGAYMTRGYIPSTDVMNNFLTSFDVDDGRTPCPIRTQTVTAPQALFTMNSDLVERESGKLAEVSLKDGAGDLRAAVTDAYQRTLNRKPSGSELDYALTYIGSDAARMKELSWLLFNLDEFIYVR
ncbi:MAG TPA: DUF1549 and DUF1553 domain-containing protein [Candidatus Sulfopaludibacter sp.]|jgi:hypothetical protein|nr:DUF1549 and DUF1553 domain-containing protein [Candidatus Sulfopaludibacter sp.]